MKKIGFDNKTYKKMQTERILERMQEFDNKLYMEFGGKMFDDFHAARVLQALILMLNLKFCKI